MAGKWSPALATISLPKQNYSENVIHQVRVSPVNIIQPEQEQPTAHGTIV